MVSVGFFLIISFHWIMIITYSQCGQSNQPNRTQVILISSFFIFIKNRKQQQQKTNIIITQYSWFIDFQYGQPKYIIIKKTNFFWFDLAVVVVVVDVVPIWKEEYNNNYHFNRINNKKNPVTTNQCWYHFECRNNIQFLILILDFYVFFHVRVLLFCSFFSVSWIQKFNRIWSHTQSHTPIILLKWKSLCVIIHIHFGLVERKSSLCDVHSFYTLDITKKK